MLSVLTQPGTQSPHRTSVCDSPHCFHPIFSDSEVQQAALTQHLTIVQYHRFSMVATRTGQHSRQQSLGDMAGVTASRKTGGGNRANEQPQQERALKRTKGGGRSGKKAAAAAEARKSTEREQDMAADDSRAIAAAVDTGESPQKKLKRDTKQAGLKAGGKPSSGAGSSSHGGSDGGAQDVRLDKSDHGDAKPAGAKRGAAGGGKGAETQAAKVVPVIDNPFFLRGTPSIPSVHIISLDFAEQIPEHYDCHWCRRRRGSTQGRS